MKKMFYQNVTLPEILNVETEDYGNNCGPLCILAIALTDFSGIIKKFKLERIVKMVKKKGKEVTMPGFMCQCLLRLGYSVQYFSKVNWENCTTIETDHWDIVMKKLTDVHLFNKNKVVDSATWLIKQPELLFEQELSLDELALFIEEGKRVIVLVNQGTHYVLLTGISPNTVHFYDPDTGKNEMMDCRHFNYYWGKSQGFSETIVCQI